MARFEVRTLAAFVLTATPPTEIYPLSLHDALPISVHAADATRREDGNAGDVGDAHGGGYRGGAVAAGGGEIGQVDRKSTRLNSSHLGISYAVFCLKKKRKDGALGDEMIDGLQAETR